MPIYEEQLQDASAGLPEPELGASNGTPAGREIPGMANAAKQGERDPEAVFNQALLSVLPDGVITYAADGQCRSANQAAAELLGVPLERLLGQNFREISSWKDSGLLARAEETLRTGSTQQWEMHFTSTAGKSPWLHFRLERVDLAGEPTLLLVFADISKRKGMEESLQLTQFSIDHSADFVHWLGPDGRILNVNESSCRRYGYSRQEMLGLTIFDLDPALSPESWPARWQKIRQGRSSTLETVHRTKGGELFPVEVTTNYVRHGGREYDVAFVRDITERKQTEEALRLTQLSVDRAADFIHWIGPEGRLLYVSDSTCRAPRLHPRGTAWHDRLRPRPLPIAQRLEEVLARDQRAGFAHL